MGLPKRGAILVLQIHGIVHLFYQGRADPGFISGNGGGGHLGGGLRAIANIRFCQNFQKFANSG